MSAQPSVDVSSTGITVKGEVMFVPVEYDGVESIRLEVVDKQSGGVVNTFEQPVASELEVINFGVTNTGSMSIVAYGLDSQGDVIAQDKLDSVTFNPPSGGGNGDDSPTGMSPGMALGGLAIGAGVLWAASKNGSR